MTNQTPIYTFTENEAAQLNIRLDQYRINNVAYKEGLHNLAYDSLRHLHNTGSPSLVQKLYDILAEDKLLRKSGYAKWILEFAPVVFNEEKKTFSVNKNPNRTKELFKDNSVKATPLLAAAYGKRFWEMDGGNERVNSTLADRITEKNESWLASMIKETKKGEIAAEVTIAYGKAAPLMHQIMEILAPITTKELSKVTETVETDVLENVEEQAAA